MNQGYAELALSYPSHFRALMVHWLDSLPLSLLLSGSLSLSFFDDGKNPIDEAIPIRLDGSGVLIPFPKEKVVDIPFDGFDSMTYGIDHEGHEKP